MQTREGEWQDHRDSVGELSHATHHLWERRGECLLTVTLQGRGLCNKLVLWRIVDACCTASFVARSMGGFLLSLYVPAALAAAIASSRLAYHGRGSRTLVQTCYSHNTSFFL